MFRQTKFNLSFVGWKNFKIHGVGKEGRQNLQNLPTTKEKQEVTFRNKLEDILGYQTASESLKLSYVIGRACVRKVERHCSRSEILKQILVKLKIW